MYIFDPVTDARWTTLVEQHPDACAFHSRGWIEALARTYGYKTIAVTSSEPGQSLADALPLCRVESWATGRRLVSLPFTDHCQPLAGSGAAAETVKFISEFAERERYRFCEFRPLRAVDGLTGANRSASYCFHSLDLTASAEAIFNRLDKDSIQRKIRRADRENLKYEEGRSPEIIDKFYRLMLLTRRRHQLPPQPIDWFRNLAHTMGDAIQFRCALKDQTPVASIVTLTHRNSIIYKYGCSDEGYHATGSMPFLFWRTIQEAQTAGIPCMDFGRSDVDNPGLIRFKDQWGTRRTELTYYRFPAPRHSAKNSGLAEQISNRTKSIVKSPKLYIADTGLLCALLNICSEEALGLSPSAGAVWETFVFAQLRARERRLGRTGSLFFWRDRTREVDFVVDLGGRLELVEAKWTELPSVGDTVNLEFVRNSVGSSRVASAAVVTRTSTDFVVANGVRALPVTEFA